MPSPYAESQLAASGALDAVRISASVPALSTRSSPASRNEANVARSVAVDQS
jgi:hypothetical protein